jgi:hypothetical protein
MNANGLAMSSSIPKGAIAYRFCVCPAWHGLEYTQIISRVQVPCMRAAKHTSTWQGREE